mmetsp:Transcript_34640/g.80429  ORF Transcript_34640/g.80429 Transcript_34640/m.80429 type:complete len:204 (+) Transcript_34640:910-1521(+)
MAKLRSSPCEAMHLTAYTLPSASRARHTIPYEPFPSLTRSSDHTLGLVGSSTPGTPSPAALQGRKSLIRRPSAWTWRSSKAAVPGLTTGAGMKLLPTLPLPLQTMKDDKPNGTSCCTVFPLFRMMRTNCSCSSFAVTLNPFSRNLSEGLGTMASNGSCGISPSLFGRSAHSCEFSAITLKALPCWNIPAMCRGVLPSASAHSN